MITTSVALAPESSDTLSRAVLDTPDGIFAMLVGMRWEPREGGWRDPDDGTVVPWQEAARRLRRRARMCSCHAGVGEGHALACELVWGQPK